MICGARAGPSSWRRRTCCPRRGLPAPDQRLRDVQRLHVAETDALVTVGFVGDSRVSPWGAPRGRRNEAEPVTLFGASAHLTNPGQLAENSAQHQRKNGQPRGWRTRTIRFRCAQPADDGYGLPRRLLHPTAMAPGSYAVISYRLLNGFSSGTRRTLPNFASVASSFSFDSGSPTVPRPAPPCDSDVVMQ
jgi:hypothetical protein